MQIENLDMQVIGKLLDWGILGVAVKYLATISSNLAKLSQKIAVLFERTDGHDRDLESHNERITHVERHMPRRGKQ